MYRKVLGIITLAGLSFAVAHSQEAASPTTAKPAGNPLDVARSTAPVQVTDWKTIYPYRAISGPGLPVGSTTRTTIQHIMRRAAKAAA